MKLSIISLTFLSTLIAVQTLKAETCELDAFRLEGNSDEEIYNSLPEDCNKDAYRLNGYHGSNLATVITYKLIHEWRGGLGSTELNQCLQLTPITGRNSDGNGWNMDYSKASYYCEKIASNQKITKNFDDEFKDKRADK